MTATERAARTAAADALCRAAYDASAGPAAGVALVAVGGYGRAELAPYSDLDVVLVHDADHEPAGLAEELWYPLWGSGHRIDHAVRPLGGMLGAAAGDLRVALGLLDVRHLAGDPHLSLRLRTTLLAQWRRHARQRLPQLRDLVEARHRLVGEVAHQSVPDVKEAEGGLRDATVLRALAATWLVDVGPADLERCRQSLLDVRDVLHDVAGRATDRVAPELWEGLAAGLGAGDAAQAQRHLRELGRRLTHLSRLAWHRVHGVLATPEPGGARRPPLERVARGVAVSRGEVVLDAGTRPDRDPVLLLRAAAEAAERDAALSPATAARLARDGRPLPEPWPAEARAALVRLLAAGPGLRHVWGTLEETGALPRILPEWEDIRLLPHASAVHRYTVDRHVVETCVEVSGLIRRVGRPDVLLVAALLHDIGKGGLTEHSAAGEPVARRVATRIGLPPDAVDLVATLVRHHLLLATTATSRDPEDPATVEHVASRVGTPEALDLLLALTEADARATSPQAWSSWRAGLVRRLATAVRASLDGDRPAPVPVPDPDLALPEAVRRDPGAVVVTAEPEESGARVTVVAPDRVGLLADVAAVLAAQRCPVREARAWTADVAAGPGGPAQVGVSVWQVAADHVDPAVLREQLVRRSSGEVGRPPPAGRRPARLQPVVEVRPEASATATVLEVRTDDGPGVVHLACAALARLDLSVRSAHVATVGPQAVDVFYVQETGAGALTDERAASAAHALRSALASAGNA